MSYFRHGDPLDDFNRYDMEQAMQEARLPRCEKCGKPINDDLFYEIDNEILCEKCMHDEYARSTEDWLDDHY